MAILSVTINAQTWRAEIETRTINGNHITKTLTLRPDHKIRIYSVGNTSYNNPIRYTGTFLGGSSDSIRIDLLMGRNKIQKPEYLKGEISPEMYDYNKRNISVALTDISYLHYQRMTENAGNFLETCVFLSILGSLAAITITPLFCINFDDMTFNTDRYKKWALGGAIGIASSVTVVFTVNKIDNRKFHFKPGSQDKKVQVWNFKYD